ncbi:hypothetical protein EVAR_4337_1 [Eumeta japonica]|uniref:Uncharacterized protein n=1 Tax=Eumeta variegata TaxID=151549 RepID=A0A4C1VC47_EUMVA|nr:hypothetical protein EVAR_4337_1 [Eumeta japonica]
MPTPARWPCSTCPAHASLSIHERIIDGEMIVETADRKHKSRSVTASIGRENELRPAELARPVYLLPYPPAAPTAAWCGRVLIRETVSGSTERHAAVTSVTSGDTDRKK